MFVVDDFIHTYLLSCFWQVICVKFGLHKIKIIIKQVSFLYIQNKIDNVQ